MDFRNEVDGGLTKHFTLDDLLTNVMIYWITNSAGTSARFYKEGILDPANSQMAKASIHVPTGIACFPHEPLSSPRAFLEYKFKNITQFTRLSKGGHFAALQEPMLLARDLFAFVSQIERK
uniref:Epoxide hydrolase 1 n=1 Tax=Plectus sambesii TaxID=2011161 RepID=A0A914W360_9BILA